MSWFQRLYQTYDNALEASQDSEYVIAPIAHKHEKANIEIHLNEKAEIEEICLLPKEEDTIVQITGDNNCNWGLAVKLNIYTGEKGGLYKNQLREWAEFGKNEKVEIVNKYIQKETLLKDLEDKKIIEKKKEKKNNKTEYKICKQDSKQKYKEPFIRWIVGFGQGSKTWENDEIIKSWQEFMKKKNEEEGICYITGKKTSLTQKHPTANGKNKLISSEDKKNFVFNGRFENADEVACIGYEVSQKAHNTLLWLTAEERGQAYINGEQKFVAWSSNLSPLPKFGGGSDELLSGNVGFDFGKKLKEKIKGYNTDLAPNADIFVIGVDNANPERASIIYYRELLGSQFLINIETWHNKYSWEQFLNNQYFVGTPSVDAIANFYLYNKEKEGKKPSLTDSQKKIKKSIVKDLIPSIIEGVKIPKYIEDRYVKRASNPVALNEIQWKSILRIACAVYKGNHYEKEERMYVDENNKDRSYLYGRLLAIIDDAEMYVLRKQDKDKERLTNAKRFMNKFAISPATTWKFLYEKFMQAYRAKIKGNWIENDVQEIISHNSEAFKNEDNSPLNGNYLLGYFCQLKFNEEKRKEIQNKKETDNDNIKQN